MLTCLADLQRLKEGRQRCLFDEVLWDQEIIADRSVRFLCSVLHVAIVFAMSKLFVGKCVDYLPAEYMTRGIIRCGKGQGIERVKRPPHFDSLKAQP